MNDKTLVERLGELTPMAFGTSYCLPSQMRRELKDHIEALEAALQFYARENSWRSCGVYMCGHSQPSSAEIDRGQRAKQALQGFTNEQTQNSSKS